MNFFRCVVLIAICVVAVQANGDCASELRRLEGWTIISAPQVDGEFEGCDFEEVIRMADGTRYRCAEYSYTYAYSPEAIVFAKNLTMQGKSFGMVKVLIENEIF